MYAIRSYYDPSAGVGTVKCFGGGLTTLYQSAGQCHKGLVKFRKVALLHRPVIHLHIDVEVVVAVPRGRITSYNVCYTKLLRSSSFISLSYWFTLVNLHIYRRKSKFLD